MKAFLLTICLCLCIATTAGAQMPPTIIQFECDLESVSLDQLEQNPANATLSWHVVNMTDSYSLSLETYRFNEWVSVVDEDVLASGFRSVTVMHPLNFGPPTFRLQVLDSQGAVVDQRTVVIPYEVDATLTPTVTTFAANVASLGREELRSGDVRVPVTWEIGNRQPHSHLRFEQVFDNGATRSVELPRGSMWVASTGAGEVAPRLPEGATTVTLRLSVVNAVDGTVYAQREIQLPITEGSAVPRDNPGEFVGPPEQLSLDDVCSEDPTYAEVNVAYAYLEANPPDVPISIWGTRTYLQTAYDELLTAGLVEPPPAPCTATARVAADIYEAPEQTAASDGWIPAGDSASIYGRNDDSSWFYVEYGNATGWVQASAVNIQTGAVIDQMPVRES